MLRVGDSGDVQFEDHIITSALQWILTCLRHGSDNKIFGLYEIVFVAVIRI
jgi:hypothetical protein